MSIDWNHFTPWTSLAGGVVIGIAAALLMLLSGRIAGVSGIAGGLLRPASGDALWRVLFIAGLVLSPLVHALVSPVAAVEITAGWGTIVAGGLLVGVGTRYAAGCTSGHGVCGLSNLSPRSLAATLTFMAGGFACVFVVRHVLGAEMHSVAALATGLIFGLGLIIAGMSNPAKVQGFLDLFGLWDPSLALVMGGAIGVGLVPFALARRMRKSIFGAPLGLQQERRIDPRLIAGSAAFGVGWGLVGFCPGPALVALGTGELKAVVFVAAMLAGMGVYEALNPRDRGGANLMPGLLMPRPPARTADTMRIDFEELDYRQTPIGELSLRRRTHVSLGVEVYEVKLGDEFLMSSLFTEGEIALADLGLADLGAGPLDVVVGGLGLGYTARAVLDHPATGSLLVIDALAAVIDWHRQGLVPLGEGLSADPRCSLRNADFFALLDYPGIDSRDQAKRFHAILVDIDHSPRDVLHATHADCYEVAGLRRLAAHLHPGGVFALWSNDPPDEDFQAKLAAVFETAAAHVVRFHNPLLNREATNTVYVARAPRRARPGKMADPEAGMEEWFPWYDSSWLSRYVLAKTYIAGNRPARLDAYVRALEPLRTRPDFQQQVLGNFFSDAELATIRAAYKAINPAMLEVDEISRHGRFVVHDHPLVTELHAAVCPRVGELVGEPVEPAYSFLAMYNRDGKCPPHLDKPISKWTLDFCIEQSEPWPIWFSQVVPWPETFAAGSDGWMERLLSSPEHRFTSTSLEPGQAVLFSGSSQWHYRDPFADPVARSHCSLLFLHFIPAGMNEVADWTNWERLFDAPGLTGALE